ncbi:MAG TPA: AAA-like domain-containing protein, partial [Anaerolineae bacterium]
MTVTNPYSVSGPVRTAAMFFGRWHELNEVSAFVHGSQSVSIIGPGRIGKTSLLVRLMRPEVWPELGLDEHNLFVYLDGETLGDGSLEVIFDRLAAATATSLAERRLAPESTLERTTAQPARLAFEAAVRQLNRRGWQVVIILDDFERLSTNPQLDVNFFNALRSAAARLRLVYVTASTRPLIELTYANRPEEILSSPFFNIFAPCFLGLLAENEARHLIDEPARVAGVPLAPTTADFIYTLAGGHPLALQLACFHAFNTPADTAAIEHNTTLDLAATFQALWSNLSPLEQQTLARLSGATLREPDNTTQRVVLRDLVQKCLLAWDGRQ